MTSFREQMKRLADNIAKTRNERKAFLDKNRKDCVKKRRELTDERNQIKIELAQGAKSLSKQLMDFKRDNQKTVQKTLRNFRSVRTKAARASRELLRQEILKNRRDIARMLRHNNSDRMRSARQQDRTSATTIQMVRSQVQRIRNETRRMTKSFSRDRNDARQIWLRLQNSSSHRWDSSLVSRAMITSTSISSTLPATPMMETLHSVATSDSIIQRASLLPILPSITPMGVS